MKWDDIQFLYEERLNHLKRLSGKMSKEALKQRYNEMYLFIRHLRVYECEDVITMKDNKLEYRGIELTILLDDYGQQFYIDFAGKEVSGGSFNSRPELLFIEAVDEQLDAKFLDF